jgi:hypothetical protein
MFYLFVKIFNLFGRAHKIAKSEIAISFVTPVRLSVRMEQLGSNWTDFD